MVSKARAGSSQENLQSERQPHVRRTASNKKFSPLVLSQFAVPTLLPVPRRVLYFRGENSLYDFIYNCKWLATKHPPFLLIVVVYNHDSRTSFSELQCLRILLAQHFQQLWSMSRQWHGVKTICPLLSRTLLRKLSGWTE